MVADLYDDVPDEGTGLARRTSRLGGENQDPLILAQLRGLRDFLRKGDWLGSDPQVGPPDLPFACQLRSDLLEGTHRDGDSPRGSVGDVHPYHLPRCVDEWAARVSRVESRVRNHGVLDDDSPPSRNCSARIRDYPGGYVDSATERVRECQHELPRLQRLRIPNLYRPQPGRLDLQHRHVRCWVAAENLRLEAPSVLQLDRCAPPSSHYVVRGHHMPLLVPDHTTPSPSSHLHLHHRR